MSFTTIFLDPPAADLRVRKAGDGKDTTLCLHHKDDAVTFYGMTQERLEKLTRDLAQAAGLFVWHPSEEPDPTSVASSGTPGV